MVTHHIIPFKKLFKINIDAIFRD